MTFIELNSFLRSKMIRSKSNPRCDKTYWESSKSSGEEEVNETICQHTTNSHPNQHGFALFSLTKKKKNNYKITVDKK